jgi:hypothetical protein
MGKAWPPEPVDSEVFWLEQAAEVRNAARRMTSRETRRALEIIALSYERLADYTRDRANLEDQLADRARERCQRRERPSTIGDD